MTDAPTPLQVADALEQCCPCRAVGEACQQHVACSYQAHGARVILDQADELACLRAENERLREWNRQMVEKAASGGTLEGYREMAAKIAILEADNERLREALEPIADPESFTWLGPSSRWRVYRHIAATALKRQDEKKPDEDSPG